jgi:hypothetical protein
MGKLRLCHLFLFFALLACEKKEPPVLITPEPEQGFLSFSTNGQTILSTSIRTEKKQVKLEVTGEVDITKLVPSFEVPPGTSVFLNGKEQFSGIMLTDFSKPVLYELRFPDNRTTEWSVAAVPLSKRIVIDASHDGGIWWFPQHEGTGFDPEKHHQGKAFADMLRSKGFKVDELGRTERLKEEHFMGYYIVIRVNGFQAYTRDELDVYAKLAKRGMNMVFFTDHKKFDPVDELGDMLGLQFKGLARGTVKKFTEHTITKNLSSLDYNGGSVLMNAGQNPDIEILGWLGEDEYADLNFNEVRDEGEPTGMPVMGILNYPKSKVFFIGDGNGLQFMPQPFIDNLLEWLKE